MDKMSTAPPKIFKSHHTNFYSNATLSPCMDYCIGKSGISTLAGSDLEHGLLIWNTKKPNKHKIDAYDIFGKLRT